MSIEGKQSAIIQVTNKTMPSETDTGSPSSTAQTPSVKSAIAKANGKAATAKGAQAAPAPGVKKVRAAYSGKGWAPPQKEWDSTKKEKGDKTKIEIEDEWDDDGNLKRTITKRTTTPDWKFKTEKTVELYSAEEAKKAGLERK